jgi:fission process protein 1
MDAFLWQSMASVLIPGKVIHLIASSCSYGMSLKGAQRIVPNKLRIWIPTIVGLSSIPLIVHPIDHGVDQLMDNTFRKWGWTTSG